MKRFILTGTPGSGKTAILRALEMKGHFVVDEAATDVIAYEQLRGIERPWEFQSFIDNIIRLQKQRQLQADSLQSELQFFDRSPICTYALAIYLGFKPSHSLMDEIERIQANNIYNQRVFFIENLGFLKNTDARKISFEEALKFEQVHQAAYAKFNYECIQVPVLPFLERAQFFLEAINSIL